MKKPICTENSRALITGIKLTASLVVVLIILISWTTVLAVKNPTTVYMRLDKNVLRGPNLYEQLYMQVKVSENQDDENRVTVIDSFMDDINDAVPLGHFLPGESVYVHFYINFDINAGNEYQNSRVSTSCEFLIQSEQKLNNFSISDKTGKVFENMVNLNPGDEFSGVICLDIGTVAEEGDDHDDDDDSTHPSETGIGENQDITEPDDSIDDVDISDDQVPKDVNPMTDDENGDSEIQRVTIIPNTSDEAPIEILAVIAAAAAVLLIIQLILFYRISKNSSKT